MHDGKAVEAFDLWWWWSRRSDDVDGRRNDSNEEQKNGEDIVDPVTERDIRRGIIEDTIVAVVFDSKNEK